jgi:hypothetical protein
VLADLLPQEHGWQAKLRIGDFEMLAWIYTSDAEARMRELLTTRLMAK